jgi:hypothetical protein
VVLAKRVNNIVPAFLAKARTVGKESCRSAGADNRRCPQGDRERQRSERISVKAPPAVKGAGGQESAVPEETH